MRFLLLVLCACSAARPSPSKAEAPLCDALPFLGSAELRALASDTQGGLAAAGEFSGSLRIGASSIASAGGTDAFVLRTEPDGSVRWLHRLGGARDDRAGAVALAANGDAVIAGSAEGKCLVARLAADDGHELWNNAFDAESFCRALAFDDKGDLWTAGSYAGSLFHRADSNGITDAVVAHLSGQTGGVSFVRGFGGKGREVARALAVAPSGDVILGGQFGGEVDVSESSVDFGRGAIASKGDFDAFLIS